MNAITKTVVDHLIDGDGWPIVKQGIEELESFDDAIPKFLQMIYAGTIDGINKEFQPEFRQMLIELTNIIANTIEVDEIVNAAMEKYVEDSETFVIIEVCE